MYLKIIFSAVAIDAAILVVQKERPGETGVETTPAVGLLRQRLTYDTFWRTFYAFRTTRSRIRNDELFDRNNEPFNCTAIIHDPSRLIRVQYLFNIGL